MQSKWSRLRVHRLLQQTDRIKLIATNNLLEGKIMNIIKIATSLMGIFAGLSVFAGVNYNQVTNTITIEGYSEKAPLKLKKLYQLDQINDWKKITCDKATDTYTIDAHLKIGNNDGTDACLKIGTKKNPTETLIVKGNVIVSPYFIHGINKRKDWQLAPKGTNLLIIGAQENKLIKASLKIACEKQGQYSLYVGLTPEAVKKGKTWTHGGGLKIYNSTLTSEGKKMGKAFINGQVFVLENAVISKIAGSLTYYLNPKYTSEFKIKDTVFDNLENAISGYKVKISGCTIKNCTTAAGDRGGADFTFENCTFKNNVCNWYLRYTSKGVTCIDCNIGKTRGTSQYRISKRKSKTLTPSFTSKRHITIKVEDAQGNPVSGAAVVAVANNQAVDPVKKNTDKEGKVILLLTEVIKTATSAPVKPKVEEFTYKITITTGNENAFLTKIKPNESWKEFKITLK